jgi:hypothetical protein
MLDDLTIEATRADYPVDEDASGMVGVDADAFAEGPALSGIMASIRRTVANFQPAPVEGASHPAAAPKRAVDETMHHKAATAAQKVAEGVARDFHAAVPIGTPDLPPPGAVPVEIGTTLGDVWPNSVNEGHGKFKVAETIAPAPPLAMPVVARTSYEIELPEVEIVEMDRARSLLVLGLVTLGMVLGMVGLHRHFSKKRGAPPMP